MTEVKTSVVKNDSDLAGGATERTTIGSFVGTGDFPPDLAES